MEQETRARKPRTVWARPPAPAHAELHGLGSAPAVIGSRSRKNASKSRPIDVESLQVARMQPELVRTRRGQVSKYTALAATLKAGDLVRCEPSQVSALANALGDWFRVNRPDLLVIIRTHKKLSDGTAGVEIRKLEPKPGAVAVRD